MVYGVYANIASRWSRTRAGFEPADVLITKQLACALVGSLSRLDPAMADGRIFTYIDVHTYIYRLVGPGVG